LDCGSPLPLSTPDPKAPAAVAPKRRFGAAEGGGTGALPHLADCSCALQECIDTRSKVSPHPHRLGRIGRWRVPVHPCFMTRVFPPLDVFPFRAMVRPVMRWQGRRRSENVEDRRGARGRGVAVGGGLGGIGILLFLIYVLLG